MKKILIFALAALLLPLLAACGGKDYTSRVTELRAAVYYGEAEDVQVTAYSGFREQPFAADGEVGDRKDVFQIRLRVPQTGNWSAQVTAEDGKTYSGKFAVNPVSHNLTLTLEMPRTSAAAIDLVLTSEEKSIPLSLENVTPEGAVEYKKALSVAAAEMKEDIAEGRGEFYVRLMRENDRFYWFCAYVTPEKTTAVLLSAEDGAVIAKRSSK